MNIYRKIVLFILNTEGNKERNIMWNSIIASEKLLMLLTYKEDRNLLKFFLNTVIYLIILEYT